jgi:hypothetical protein
VPFLRYLETRPSEDALGCIVQFHLNYANVAAHSQDQLVKLANHFHPHYIYFSGWNSSVLVVLPEHGPHLQSPDHAKDYDTEDYS